MEDTNDPIPPVLLSEDQGPDPTPEQAKAMFAARPDLASVVTTEGILHRSGELVR